MGSHLKKGEEEEWPTTITIGRRARSPGRRRNEAHPGERAPDVTLAQFGGPAHGGGGGGGRRCRWLQ